MALRVVAVTTMVAKQVTITSELTKTNAVAGVLADHHQHLHDIDTTNEGNDNEPNTKHASRNASQSTGVVYGALSITLETHSAAHCERAKEVSTARQHDTDMVSTTWNLQQSHSDAFETYTQVSGGAHTTKLTQSKKTHYREAPCDEAAATHTNKNSYNIEPTKQCDRGTTAQESSNVSLCGSGTATQESNNENPCGSGTAAQERSNVSWKPCDEVTAAQANQNKQSTCDEVTTAQAYQQYRSATTASGEHRASGEHCVRRRGPESEVPMTASTTQSAAQSASHGRNKSPTSKQPCDEVTAAWQQEVKPRPTGPQACPHLNQPSGRGTALMKASLAGALCVALAISRMRRGKSHSNQDSMRVADDAPFPEALPGCKFSSLSKGPGTDALLTAIGAESVTQSTASESSGCLFMMMASAGRQTSQRDRAIWAMQGDNNELFFLLMLKAHYLAQQEKVRVRDIMREYTLTQINDKVDDSLVEKGTAVYPASDESDYGEDYESDYGQSDYESGNSNDESNASFKVGNGFVIEYNNDRGFGFIGGNSLLTCDSDNRVVAMKANNGEDIFFHISDVRDEETKAFIEAGKCYDNDDNCEFNDGVYAGSYALGFRLEYQEDREKWRAYDLTYELPFM